jgi:hypothetical protein
MQCILNIHYQNFKAYYYYLFLRLTDNSIGLRLTDGKISMSVGKSHLASLSNCLTQYHHLRTFSVLILVYRPHSCT